VELAVLKSVIENVDLQWGIDLLRIHFGELAGIVSFRSHIDRHAGFARNQQRLIAVLLGCALGLDPGRLAARAAVTAGKYIDVESSSRKEASQSDGERCFAGAADGEIADADDGVLETPDGLPAVVQTKFAPCKGGRVERHQR
jgi:hypothetical protein